MKTKQKTAIEVAVDAVMDAFDKAEKELSDSEYLDVLDELIGNFQTKVDAKKEEQKSGGQGDE